MAYSNQTTHYGLPLPVGSDKSSWLDTNTAFAAIDTAIYQASTDAGAAAGDIAQLQNDVTSLQSGKQDVLTFDATPTNGSLNPVRSGGVYSSIESVSIALGVTDLKVSALGNAMGNTDISAIGDGTVTGAISNINGKIFNAPTQAREVIADTGITSGSVYTMTKDGWVTVTSARPNASDYCGVTSKSGVDTLLSITHSGSTGGNLDTIMLPVKSGDTVTIVFASSVTNVAIYITP